MKTFLLLAALFIGLSTGAATGPAHAAGLTPSEEKLVDRVEVYLNAIDRISADFVQIASTGEVAKGELYIARPGRIRIDYADPIPILIVGNYGDIAYVDLELEQVSFIGIDDTPLAFLLAEEIDLRNGLEITNVAEAQGLARIDMVQTDNPDDGSLSVVFETDPLTLKQWVVRDARGVQIMLSLVNPDFRSPIDPETFAFDRQKWTGEDPFGTD